MSTLKVNDIQEATSGGGKIFPARAWVSFNGTGTVSIASDGNVSSITDNGTGDYEANYANSLSGSPASTLSSTSEVNVYHTVGFIIGVYTNRFHHQFFNVTNSSQKADKAFVSIHSIGT